VEARITRGTKQEVVYCCDSYISIMAVDTQSNIIPTEPSKPLPEPREMNTSSNTRQMHKTKCELTELTRTFGTKETELVIHYYDIRWPA
jgi:hypothetical protein